jgi:hypothetical protein
MITRDSMFGAAVAAPSTRHLRDRRWMYCSEQFLNWRSHGSHLVVVNAVHVILAFRNRVEHLAALVAIRALVVFSGHTLVACASTAITSFHSFMFSATRAICTPLRERTRMHTYIAALFQQANKTENGLWKRRSDRFANIEIMCQQHHQ